jgi:hypothetical protein
MVDGVNWCAVIPWIRHVDRGGTLFDVVVQIRCSEVPRTAFGSSRSRGCSRTRSSRSRGRGRSRTGSSRSRGRGRSRTGKRAGAYQYAPQKPYRSPIPSRIARQTAIGGNCSRKQCVRTACVGNGREQQQRGRRERSPKQEYLGVRECMCARGGSPLI